PKISLRSYFFSGVGRLGQDAFETGVQFARDCRDPLIPEWTKERGGAVIFEDRVTGLVFIEHHAQRRVERGRQPVLRHLSGGEWIADLILHGVASKAGDAQQSAVIPGTEDRKLRTALQRLLGPLDVALPQC